jgi:hypothetical protein
MPGQADKARLADFRRVSLEDALVLVAPHRTAFAFTHHDRSSFCGLPPLKFFFLVLNPTFNLVLDRLRKI